MSYTKASPQPTELPAGAVGVTLDDGQNVILELASVAQKNGAPSVLVATATAAGSDWAPSGTASTFSHAPPPELANDPERLAQLRHALLMAVLGEPAEAPFIDPIHAAALANASIRNQLAAVAIAGPVDAGALL